MESNKATLGEVCTEDSECDGMVNLRCSKMYECTKGLCDCQSEYGSTILSGYQEPCGTGYHCDGVNQTCNGSHCDCESGMSGAPWRGCASGSGGNSWGRAVGIITTTTRFGEYCASSPVCDMDFDPKTVSEDTSNFRPTCQQNACSCPASHEQVSVKSWKLCLELYEETLTEIGEECRDWNECASKFCVKCPNATSGVCMDGSHGPHPSPGYTLLTYTICLLLVVVILF
ncbi:hypothetical protein MAR_012989 [Mya arenaria]|uniref:Uncharacterized protein n=1 Tax=Mya arenaria TaxID=6604 RepID=A0ABY7FZ94_MYAAR|nr:hypothetical protein MAR_012989 [Mya arenaria]